MTLYAKTAYVFLLKEAAKIEKGLLNPIEIKLLKVKRDKVKEIAEIKMPDLNTDDIDSAMKIAEGTARSMGIEIE